MTSDWSLITLQGPDAITFLQGQFTTDISKLSSEKLQLSAYCNIQGRVIATFFLRRHDGVIELTLPRSMESIVLKRLRKFVMRSKVIITEPTPTAAPFSNAELIEAGIPILQPENSEAFVAQRLNLDTLGAIHFDKGCYVGQEIIARLHYRGQSKHHTYRVKIKSQEILPPQSPLLNDQGIVCGYVVNSIQLDNDNQLALAVLADEFIRSTTFIIEE